MTVDKNRLAVMFRRVAALWLENAGELSRIDSLFGDGDHGVTMGKIAETILEDTEHPHDESLRQFTADLASRVLDVPGGSASPLYGTFFEGMAGAIHEDARVIDSGGLKAMLAGGRGELRGITKAGVGDKTLMDALLPAVAAAENASGSVREVLRAAWEAAEAGCKATEGYASKFGRARSYGDRTLGFPDVGAVSMALLFRGFYEGGLER